MSDGATGKTGPLDGLRVIDWTMWQFGPVSTMMLADLGAEVIKVESLDGDHGRQFSRVSGIGTDKFGTATSYYFEALNRQKQGIALNLKHEKGQEVIYRLVEQSDVFVQNFRPGVAERLGAGEEELRKINPKLVYCAISGLGASGPAKDRPVYDSVAQAASGYLRLLTPPENPRVIGPAIADAVTGQYAAMACIAALFEREKRGEGRRIDISMLEAMCHFNLDSFTHYYSVGEVMGPLSRPTVSQSYTFECADGIMPS